MGRAIPERHVSIDELDVRKFAPQTTETLEEILNHLQTCGTVKEKQMSEVALGWKTATLERSLFASPILRGWAKLESIVLDSMHCYHSNGHIAQEIGLWYTALLRAGYKLETLLQYVALGWKSFAGDSIARSFDAKMFRPNEDYRGDAKDCGLVLSICTAFAAEVLQECLSMQKENASLQALQEVVVLLAKCKLSVCFAEILEIKQRKHGAAFLDAYDTSVVRPKFHYAKHLVSQMLVWGKHVDCFVCERKHRLFKTVVGPKLNKLSNFSKSALLQLTECDLQQTHLAENFTGCLSGKSIENVTLATSLHLPCDTLFAPGAEYRCVTYRKNNYIEFSRDVCLQIHGACQVQKQIHLLVEQLVPSKTDTNLIHSWSRTTAPWKLCPVHSVAQCEPMRLCRERDNKIFLLRWYRQNAARWKKKGHGEKKGNKRRKKWKN